MGDITKWASMDLSVIGRDDDKACTSLSYLCRGILDGIYQLRHINIVSIILEWCDDYVTSEVLRAVVYTVCSDFNHCVEHSEYEPTSSISDLLVKRKLPELPSTLICNDYVDIDMLRSLLRRYFNEA